MDKKGYSCSPAAYFELRFTWDVVTYTRYNHRKAHVTTYTCG